MAPLQNRNQSLLLNLKFGKNNSKKECHAFPYPDTTTSYGSYSGAVPNEKITWGKLDIKTPKFIIESDATIVAPLIFAYLLDL